MKLKKNCEIRDKENKLILYISFIIIFNFEIFNMIIIITLNVYFFLIIISL